MFSVKYLHHFIIHRPTCWQPRRLYYTSYWRPGCVWSLLEVLTYVLWPCHSSSSDFLAWCWCVPLMKLKFRSRVAMSCAPSVWVWVTSEKPCLTHALTAAFCHSQWEGRLRQVEGLLFGDNLPPSGLTHRCSGSHKQWEKCSGSPNEECSSPEPKRQSPMSEATVPGHR